MSKTITSQTDLNKKVVSFVELAPGSDGYIPEGDPKTGVIISDKDLKIIKEQAGSKKAVAGITKIRSITDRPVNYLLLTR